MSNEKPGGNPGRRNPKVSRGRFVRPGSAGPKARPKGVADGQRVNIPALSGGVEPRGRAAGAGARYGSGRACGFGRRPEGIREDPAPRCTAAPGKAARGPSGEPYRNRHRWEGALTHQGAREKPRQGTRQTSPVTSGEGVPREGAQRTGPCSCLTKTQHSANAQADTWSVTRDQCGKVKARGQPRGEAPNRSPRECRP